MATVDAKWPKPKRMCYHLEWYSYGQSRPEPAEIVYLCECGENWACSVCGWGAGTHPCSCMRERQAEEKQDLRSWYDDTSVRYAEAWKALGKL